MTQQSHDFQPILNNDRFAAAATYIATRSVELARTVLGHDLSIDTICFFAQSPEEYDFLLAAVRKRGPDSRFSHGPTTYVDSDFMVADQHIRILGVRQPDPTRLWVGYGDYPVAEQNYDAIKASGNPYIHEIISGRGRPLLQFKHPDFDVLGFAVNEDDHLTA